MCNGIGFCFESQSATAVFSYRALDFFLGVVTESVFVLGFHDEIGFFRSCFCSCGFSHDEMPFCFGGSRRDAILFWGFVTRCHFVFGVRDE